MKGTSQRGRWPGEDRALARRLAADEKNRAENVMIVDLMRNDLGRICRFGSVRLRRLFTVERYRSVLQMTSTIDGRLRSDTTLVDILRAVLPAGSVTGAPKKRACEILDGLEMHERGVYCGQIGSFAPNGDFSLNVAIRTIVRRGSRCLLGVGSGIVADSNARQELAETRLKSAFVRSGPDGFRLLETILWRNGRGYIFLDEHVRRMQRSARYFGWQFPEARVRTALESAASGIRNHQARVRLLLSRTNDCTVQVEHLPDDPAFRQSVSRLWLSSQRTDPSDVFLFHKTTQRMLYESELRAARERGFLDALFVNLDGHVTEGAVSNVLVLIDGNWYTPPLSCGLLAGIWRSRILRRAAVHRRRIRLEDLGRASRVIVGNSVRGPIDVDRIESEGSVLFSRNAAGDDIDQFRTA